MNTKMVKVTAILLGAMLAASPQADAAAGKTQTVPVSAKKTLTPIGNIGLGNSVSAALEHADVWQQNGSHVAVFTLNYKNKGKSTARLVTYFPRVVLPDGSVTAANPVTRDITKKGVEPGQSLSVTYYAKISTSSLSGMKVAMDVWNPKVKGYLQRVGAYKLPTNYSPAVAPGTSTMLKLGGTPVTVQTESLQIIKYNGKVMAKVGMYITNRGGMAWTDSSYNPYLVTGSGTSFLLQREAGKDGSPVQPKEKKLVYYITEIPSYLKTTDLRFQWTENDETLKLALPVAAFKLPAATAPTWDIAPGSVKTLTLQGNRVDARVRKATLRASDDQAVWNIEIAFKNKGNKPAQVPAYEYAIKASEGSFHPYVPADKTAAITLRPKEEKTISMEISLPLNLKQDRLKLQMIESSGSDLPAKPPADSDESGSTTTATDNSGRMIVPIAYFSLSYQEEHKASIGVEYDAQTANGFAYTVESMQRLPWQDTDLIVAKLRLRNTHDSNSSLLPELKVNVKADERTVLAGSEVIADEQGSLIAPGGSAEVYVMTRIPYTKNIRSLRFELFTQKDTAKSPFLTLTTSGTMRSIEALEKGKSYSIKTPGKRADAQERRTVIYDGTDSDIIYTELTLTSGEQRRVQAARLKGYFQSTDGNIYEADTVQPETALQPGAKQSVVFWARVPKGAASDISLAVGTAMSGGKLAETGKDITGVLAVKKLQLNPVRPAVSSGLTQLDWFPYKVSVTNAVGHLQEGSSTISLKVTFDVKRSESITAADAGHKLILIITDQLGNTQERTLTPGTDIQVPGTRSASFELTDELYKKLRSGGFKLTLVDEFQNERITLGSQSYGLKVQLNEDPYEDR
ncbi:hypothetical protein MNQ98_04165 [Paenibacillus sp. N3/727]|uniref:hypothetical protein n=1 Tax=Paenibacillus sp. N3/727 TaxID=2925845 RepID=UPI001F53D82A|nr:hypothetical protein [Paenibacillus sp. N3/727]UNK19241.1 hypothetical protein MNQ98_04165 [Paenibacillus sp. N3/727]